VLFDVEDVRDLQEEAAVGAQRPRPCTEGPHVVLIGLEVAEGTAAHAQDQVELVLEEDVARIDLDEIGIAPARPR
jgi:hypothetical protein